MAPLHTSILTESTYQKQEAPEDPMVEGNAGYGHGHEASLNSIPLDSAKVAAHMASEESSVAPLLFPSQNFPILGPFCYFPIFSGVPFVSEKHRSGAEMLCVTRAWMWAPHAPRVIQPAGCSREPLTGRCDSWAFTSPPHRSFRNLGLLPVFPLPQLERTNVPSSHVFRWCESV